MKNEDAIKRLKEVQAEFNENWVDYGGVNEAFQKAYQALETGEIYITGEDYNLYMEGYKAGKKDFEPKQGEWEKCQNDMFRCSKCRQADEVPTAMGAPIYNFCPNCGADMRKDGEEQ